MIVDIPIDKFKCNNCGKNVKIKSIVYDGSMFDYLCPRCYNKRGGIYYEKQR